MRCQCHLNPVICPTHYNVRNTWQERILPVIHPTVNINRHNIVTVPRHFYPQRTENVVVNHGIVNRGPGFGGPGFGGPGFGGPGFGGPGFGGY